MCGYEQFERDLPKIAPLCRLGYSTRSIGGSDKLSLGVLYQTIKRSSACAKEEEHEYGNPDGIWAQGSAKKKREGQAL